MDREILFRGKYVGNGEWVYGTPVPVIINCYLTKRIELVKYHSYDELDYFSLLSNDEDVIPETVGQYTGLTDKNGVKIFEGDILSGSCGRKSTEYFEVWWSEASCGFVAGRGERMRPNMNQAAAGRYEIAGNIHDGQEIL